MKAILTMVFGAMLLSPGMAAAADRQGVQEPSASLVVKVVPPKLDLNAVSLEQLVGVPGIGPRLAQEIIELRARRGSFTKIEELLEVTGIKEKKLASISRYVEVMTLPASGSVVPPTQKK